MSSPPLSPGPVGRVVREICYRFVSSGVTAPGVVRVVCACVVYESVWCARVCAGGAAARGGPDPAASSPGPMWDEDLLSIRVVPPLRPHLFGGPHREQWRVAIPAHISTPRCPFPHRPCRGLCGPLALGAL